MKTLKIDSSWTLFLDRDGVINKRLIDDYVKTTSEFEFIEGAEESIALFNQLFARVLVITNQQGIGKELMSHEDLDEIHAHMNRELEGHGGKIDRFYYCSMLASDKHNCRKPNPAMGLWAKKDFPEIDFQKSIMVGDSISDIEFGNNLGMTTVFISPEKKDINITDFQTTTLANFASLLKDNQSFSK
jgi:histidinol-phosphate phosphatase family protein